MLLEKVLQQFAFPLGIHAGFFVNEIARILIVAQPLFQRLAQIGGAGDPQNLYK